MESNYEAGLSGVRKFYKDEIAVYQVKPQVLTRAEAKQLFSDQIAFLEKKLELKKVSQIVNLSGSAGGMVRTQVKDSLILRSDPVQSENSVGSVQSEKTVVAKAFDYSDSNIYLSGIIIDSIAEIRYKYFARIQIARSLDHREGFWNKITLQPIKRHPVYSFFSNDTSFVFEKISVIDIDQ